jgi:gluconokinase
MSMGIPLTDEDRMPWLESLRDAIKESIINKKGLILGCSALKKQYREILRSGDPDYKLETYASAVNFILLDVPAEVLIARLNKRAAEGKHYMPASLLQSQLDLLNIDESEGILKVDATLSPESIVNSIKEMHPFQGYFQS